MAEDPRAHLLATANGFMRSKCLHAAVQLGVADALAGGPLSAAALAAKLGAKPDHLRRALRYLVHHCGIFQETEPGEEGSGVGGCKRC